MFEQIKCKSYQSEIFIYCYYITIILSITFMGFSIFYTSSIQKCIENEMSHLDECVSQIIILENIIILNLLTIVINFMAFTIMSMFVDIVNKHN